jgi:hypothetical protein
VDEGPDDTERDDDEKKGEAPGPDRERDGRAPASALPALYDESITPSAWPRRETNSSETRANAEGS